MTADEPEPDPIERRDRVLLRHIAGFVVALVVQWSFGALAPIAYQTNTFPRLARTAVDVVGFEWTHWDTLQAPDDPRMIESGLPFRGNRVAYTGGRPNSTSPRVQDFAIVFRPPGLSVRGSLHQTVVVPLRPNPGLAVANAAILYAAIAWYPLLRRHRRLRAGRCPACKYPLLRSGAICSECGVDPEKD